MLLVLLGNGIVANAVLENTKGHAAGWLTINFGWAMAVFVAVFCTAATSGAHLNPAVTVAVSLSGSFPWADAPFYIAAQLAGAGLGAALVWLFYRSHFNVSSDPDLKLACFCTAPAIRDSVSNSLSEFVATLVLLIPIFLIRSPTVSWTLEAGGVQSGTVGLGSLGALPVALLVFAIGMSLGGTTGYAINPARDLGPRLAHALLPIDGKRDSDWGYALVPVLAPLAAAVVAGILFRG